MTVHEAELLTRIAAGDLGPPVEELYDRFGPRLYGLGLRLLGASDLAEELVQETFVRLWQAAGRYDAERGTVGTFVAIARRVAVDLWRRPSSRPFGELPDDEQGLAVEDAVDQLVVGLAVRDALASLPEAQRDVLELIYLQDLTQQQVADRLGTPLGTVKTRAFYGLRALRVELRDRDVDA